MTDSLLAGLLLPADPALDALWAKSPADGATTGESLVEHTIRVLRRLADLRRLRPALAPHLAFPELWHCLFWAAFLHDWGKAATGFQAQLRPAAEPWRRRH